MSFSGTDTILNVDSQVDERIILTRGFGGDDWCTCLGCVVWVQEFTDQMDFVKETYDASPKLEESLFDYPPDME